jgi:hypothetical protein
MRSVLDETEAERRADAQTESNRQQEEDEAEIARRIEKSINEAKAAVAATLEDGKVAAERLLRHGRYALEDGLSELTHTIKRHPISFLGIAFAAGAAFGLLISHSSKGQETTGE